MTIKKSIRNSPRGNRSKRTATTDGDKHVYGVYVPESLHEAIENERDTLSKAESILRCLMISLEHNMDPVKGPYYPDIAEAACKLVSDALRGLDSLTLRNHVMRAEAHRMR